MRALSGESVELVGLSKKFGDVTAVHPLDLHIEPGELVVLVGPSGCGKTTVLRMIAGLEDPTAGQILIGGRDVVHLDPAQRDIAMVFQNYALYPHMTVEKNLAFGLRMRGASPEETRRRVAEAADMLGLGDLLARRPQQLSGGQKQRVALGRAMVREPRVFLFDEPLSNLDAQLRTEMRREIAELHRRLETTMIYVTHDQVEAMTLGDRVVILDGGRLQQCATPMDAYREPANLFVAGFLGTPRINTVEGRVERSDRECFVCPAFRLELPSGLRPDSAVLALRPEALVPASSDDAEADFTATIDHLEALGNEVLIYVKADGLDWTIRAPGSWAAGPGSRIGVTIDRARIHLFDARTGARA